MAQKYVIYKNKLFGFCIFKQENKIVYNISALKNPKMTKEVFNHKYWSVFNKTERMSVTSLII